jgi:hypothetical protein
MAATLPQQLNLNDMQNRWATVLNPVIQCPLVNGSQLTNIKLTIGNNVVNHLLGRKLQGWVVVGNNAVMSLYDTQASNQTPQLTLNLVSDADVTVSLWVY